MAPFSRPSAASQGLGSCRVADSPGRGHRHRRFFHLHPDPKLNRDKPPNCGAATLQRSPDPSASLASDAKTLANHQNSSTSCKADSIATRQAGILAFVV